MEDTIYQKNNFQYLWELYFILSKNQIIFNLP